MEILKLIFEKVIFNNLDYKRQTLINIKAFHRAWILLMLRNIKIVEIGKLFYHELIYQISQSPCHKNKIELWRQHVHEIFVKL